MRIARLPKSRARNRQNFHSEKHSTARSTPQREALKWVESQWNRIAENRFKIANLNRNLSMLSPLCRNMRIARLKSHDSELIVQISIQNRRFNATKLHAIGKDEGNTAWTNFSSWKAWRKQEQSDRLVLHDYQDRKRYRKLPEDTFLTN